MIEIRALKVGDMVMDGVEYARVRVNAFESGFSGSVLMWR